MSYRNYLNENPHWKQLKEEALIESRKDSPTNNMFGRCMKCGYEPWKPCLQLHHLNYDHVGHETLEDVILLCPKCHTAAHGKELGKRGSNTKDTAKTAT